MPFGVNLFIEFVHDVNRSLGCTVHTSAYKCYIRPACQHCVSTFCIILNFTNKTLLGIFLCVYTLACLYELVCSDCFRAYPKLRKKPSFSPTFRINVKILL